MVKFNTVFDASVTREANKHQHKKMAWVYVVFTALFVLLGVMDVLDGYLVSGIVWIVFGVGFYPLVLLFTKLLQKGMNKSMSVMSEETHEEYQFYEDHVVIIQTKGEDFKGTTEAKYNYFYQAVETKTHYLLYISKTQVHVIDKSKITEGTLEEMNEILRKQMPEGKFDEYRGA